MQPRTKFSLWYYIVVFAVILAVDSTLFSGAGVPQIAYSEFLARVETNQVERAVITQDEIYGAMKAPTPAGGAAAPSPSPATGAAKPLSVPGHQTPWRLDLSAWWQRMIASETRYREPVAEREAEAEAARGRQFTVIPLHDPKLVETLQA